MTPALVARGLAKRYGDVAAVDGLDLRVESGELYGFLGPNGAGKTTTIRMALGLILPTSGEVGLLGERVTPGRAPLERVGSLVEEPAFWRYLTGRKNLELFARAGGSRGDRARRLTRIDSSLDTVGLSAAADKRVRAYSQGMRQRLGLALALLGEPELLVLDEPTNGLDPGGMREIRRLLRRLADDGTTVFVSSHLLAEVEAMCDRVGVMARGRLVAEGPPRSLRGTADAMRLEVEDGRAAEAVVAELPGVALREVDDAADTQTPAGIEALTSMEVVLVDGVTPADVNEALVRAGVRVHSIEPVRTSLEDVFLELTEGLDVPR